MVIRWWRARRRLRRIADLEHRLDIGSDARGWWALRRSEWYDMHGGYGTDYSMPELERQYRRVVRR